MDLVRNQIRITLEQIVITAWTAIATAQTLQDDREARKLLAMAEAELAAFDDRCRLAA